MYVSSCDVSLTVLLSRRVAWICLLPSMGRSHVDALSARQDAKIEHQVAAIEATAKLVHGSPAGVAGLLPSIMCKWTRPFWGADCRSQTKKTVATAGRSYGGPSEKFSGRWGGIFRSFPLTSQKLPLCGNHQTQSILGQLLRSLPQNPRNFSEVAPEVRPAVHTLFLRLTEGTQKPLRQPPFAGPALRELGSACRFSNFLRCCHCTHGLLFRGSAGSPERVSSSLRPKPSAFISSV